MPLSRASRGVAAAALLISLGLMVLASAPGDANRRAGTRAAVTGDQFPAMTAGSSDGPMEIIADDVMTWPWTRTGRMERVADGDTILAIVPDEITRAWQLDESGHRLRLWPVLRDAAGAVRIRLAGIQAMERGQCHAGQATRRLVRLLPTRSLLTVHAEHSGSAVLNARHEMRPLRYVMAGRGADQTDVQAQLLADGLVFPDSIQNETRLESAYSVIAQQAAVGRLGLWDRDACGAGPTQWARLTILVNYNADGNDTLHPERRFIRIVNQRSSDVRIGGWTVRTAKHSQFTFPRGTVIRGHRSVEVRLQDRAGLLRDTHRVFYWDKRGSLTNPDVSKYRTGGAFLIDPDGDVRAETLYPCRIECERHWPDLSGRLAISVIKPHWPLHNRSRIVVENVSQSIVHLAHYVIDLGRASSLELPAGTWMRPGERLLVYTYLRPRTTRLVHHFSDRQRIAGADSPHPWDQRTVLRSHESVVMACVIGFDTPC